MLLQYFKPSDQHVRSSEMLRQAYGASVKWKLFPEEYANHSILMMLPLYFPRTWSHQVALWVLVVPTHSLHANPAQQLQQHQEIDYKPLRLKILTTLVIWSKAARLHAVAETPGMPRVRAHLHTDTTTLRVLVAQF